MFSNLCSEDPIVKWNRLPILDLTAREVLPADNLFVVWRLSAGLTVAAPLGRAATVTKKSIPKSATPNTGGVQGLAEINLKVGELMRPFVYESASSAQQAATRGGTDSAFIAGGTTIIDLMKLEVMKPSRLVDLNPLQMRGIEMGRIVNCK